TLAAGAALAQPAPVGGLPKLLQAQGYAQPDITPGLCKTVSAQETQCVIPQMTAGLYEIGATGTSTATAAGAQQRLVITVGAVLCNQAQTNPNPNWAANTPKTLKVVCQANILTDSAMSVSARYADAKATKDPKGPTLAIRRLPWPGVINSAPAGAGQQ